ncbi:MAG TPA: type 1 glutamine amidotransferase, partial [Candidatus Saccharimonadales bacterium]
LLVLGGPDSANDPTDKMQQELAQIKRALEHGTPCLGICLGLQTLVKAAGGGVVPSKEREIGFMGAAGEQYTVQLTRAGRSDPLFTGLPGTLSVFQLHGETVELTSDMTVLASGKHCQDQIVHIADKAYGIQSHFELTPEMLKIWGREDPDLQSIGLSSLRAGFEDIRESYTHIGTTLLNNFLHIAGLK